MTLPSRITDAELAALPLDAGLDALLDEIRAEETPRGRRRWPLVVAAAAAVAVVVAVPTLLAARADREPGQPAGRPTYGFPDGRMPGEPTRFVVPPNLVQLDVPGWRIVPERIGTSTEGVAVDLAYVNDGRTFDLTWYDRSEYAERGGAEPGTQQLEMFGVEVSYSAFPDDMHVVRTPPVGPYYLGIEASGMGESEFRGLVASLRAVDELDLPPGTIQPSEVEGVMAELYGGAELPDGFVPERAVAGWNTREAIVDAVERDIRCGWARAYVDGDADQRAEVVAALERAPQWPLVQAEPAAWDRMPAVLDLIADGDDDEVEQVCGY